MKQAARNEHFGWIRKAIQAPQPAKVRKANISAMTGGGSKTAAIVTHLQTKGESMVAREGFGPRLHIEIT